MEPSAVSIQHETSLLISSEAYEELPSDLWARVMDSGEIELKGREQLQRVYSLQGNPDTKSASSGS